MTQQSGSFVKRLNGVARAAASPEIMPIVKMRAAAEVVSIATAIGADEIVKGTALSAPYDRMKDWVAQQFVLPNFDRFNQFMQRAESIEPPKDRAEREKLPREEQARIITDLVVDQFGLKGIAGIVGQFAAQEFLTHRWGIKVSGAENIASIGVDRAVGLGSMVVLNTLTPDMAVTWQNGIAKILRSCGAKEDKSREWGNYLVNMQIPNLLGFASAIATLSLFASRKR